MSIFRKPGYFLSLREDPRLCPAEEGVGCFGEVDAIAALQGLAGCEDGAFFWRGDLDEGGVFTNVAPCLEVADGLHAEAGCFEELGEDCRAFFMHDLCTQAW